MAPQDILLWEEQTGVWAIGVSPSGRHFLQGDSPTPVSDLTQFLDTVPESLIVALVSDTLATISTPGELH
jgi:hypothetical protein